MSDALSDGARMSREYDAYSDYLEALKDYLETKTDGSFSRFMSLAAEAPERLRGWGGLRLDLTDALGREYLDKLVSRDLETWATLLRTARLEKAAFMDVLWHHHSPFANKVLLFYDARSDSIQVELAYNTGDLLKVGGIPREQHLAEGKYLIAFPAPDSGVLVVRADKKGK